MRLKDVSIVLMAFGVVVVLCSFLDFYTLYYPIMADKPDWTFMVSQNTASLVTLPALGILMFWVGLNLSGLRHNNIAVNTAKFVCGALCTLFFLLIVLNMAMYGLSVNSVKTNKLEAVKAENNTIRQQINAEYKQNKAYIPVEKYDMAMKQLEDDLTYKINYINLTYVKTNVKTLATLFLFAILYLIAAIKLFTSTGAQPKGRRIYGYLP
jgi:hypothetical protein